jgi:hypothetical protein
MGIIIERIRNEILGWPYVTAEPHRFGGVEFSFNKREMGHIHGERVADMPFSMTIRNELVESGRVRPHHVLPQSGWVSYYIDKEDDITAVIDLFRLQYQQLKPRSKSKQEESSSGNNLAAGTTTTQSTSSVISEQEK